MRPQCGHILLTHIYESVEPLSFLPSWVANTQLNHIYESVHILRTHIYESVDGGCVLVLLRRGK